MNSSDDTETSQKESEVMDEEAAGPVSEVPEPVSEEGGVPEPDAGGQAGPPLPDAAGPPLPDVAGGAPPPDAGAAPVSTFVPPTIEELAPLFPNLEFEAMIAAGGMGAVYRVLQPQLDRHVALKILPPESGKDPDYVERFGREAKLMAQLNHPNIVSIYDFGNTEGLLYFVMEFVDGYTLHDAIQTGTIAAQTARMHMMQVSAGLKYAHAKDVLHLDIKPGNLMVNQDGVVKILDFGLASLVGHGDKETFGTPLYTAPERYSGGGKVDHRADIYSMGAVFYELLVGTPPSGACPSASAASGSPPAFDAIINKCLQADPAKRYPDAGALLAALKKVKNARSPAQLRAGAGPAIGRTAASAGDYRQAVEQSQKKNVVLMAVAAIAVIAGLLFFLMGDKDPKKKSGPEVVNPTPGENPVTPVDPTKGSDPEPVIDNSPRSEDRFQAGAYVGSSEAPRVAGRKVEIHALIETAAGEGVIVKHGNSKMGYSLYFKNGYLYFYVRTGKNEVVELKSSEMVVDTVVSAGAVLDPSGQMTLLANNQVIGKGTAKKPLPAQPEYGVMVGTTGSDPVGKYLKGSDYGGYIQEVVIRTAPPGDDGSNPLTSGGEFNVGSPF